MRSTLLFLPFLLASSLLAQTPVTAVPSTMFGTHLHTAGSSTWPTVSVGALGHSTGFSWVYIEPNAPVSGVHTYTWTNLDYWVSISAAHGAKYIWSQSGIPRWAAADVTTCTLTPVGGAANSECTGEVAAGHIADWDAFAVALVTRYAGQIPMYELWGEPYNTAGYTGSIAHMVVLTQHMHDAIRAHDPTALVGSQTIYGYNTSWANSFYAAGGTTDVDVITTHGEPGSIHGESIMGSLSTGVRSVMSTNGMTGKPVWDTEAEPGVTLTSAQEVAWVATSYILHWNVGFIRQYWYGWDYGDAGDALVGTASATAYQQVHDWMVGSTMSTCSLNGGSDINNSVYTCDLTAGATTRRVVWNSGGSSTYTVPGGYTQYTDLAGATRPISGSTLSIGNAPILLSSQGNNYYVATTGSDSAAGTLGAPFLTIQHAAGLVNPGDTVIVENGTYSCASCTGDNVNLVNPARAGSAGNYITFQSQNPYGAVLDGLTNSSGVGTGGAFNVSANYIRIQGFEIKGFSELGITNFHGGQFQDYVGNKIHDIGRFCTDSSTGREAFFISSDNVTIEQNLIYNIGRLATGENGCTNSTTNWQNHDHGVYLESNNITIQNNIFYNNVHGWSIQAYAGSSANLHILNNTFALPNPNRPGHIILAEPVSSALIENNIFYQPNTIAIDIDTSDGGSVTGGLTLSHNLTTTAMADLNGGGGTDPATTGLTYTGNLESTNPLLANPSGADFHLTSGSPAIDAGLTISGVTNDYVGTARPQGSGYDMGAYEFNGGSGPTISSFTASPASIFPGGSSTLTLSSSGATSCSISPTVGAVSCNGTASVSPGSTTIYTAAVSNSTGTVRQAVTVTVIPPTIASFTASPVTITSGGSSTLSWSTSGSTSLSINQGVGVVTGTTSVSVSPTVTTSYTLSATNSAGTTTQTATVTIAVAAKTCTTLILQ